VSEQTLPIGLGWKLLLMQAVRVRMTLQCKRSAKRHFQEAAQCKTRSKKGGRLALTISCGLTSQPHAIAGGSSAAWSDVSAFYSNWINFATYKEFSWVDEYNPASAPNRKVIVDVFACSDASPPSAG